MCTNAGGGGGGAQAPAYLKETDKAVQLKLSVKDYDLEQTKSRAVWVPKSQLAEDGKPGEWITEQKAQEFYSRRRATSQYSATWEDAEGTKFKASQTPRERDSARVKEERMQQSATRYNNLVNMARSTGVKGIRQGMKATTIIRLLNEAGISYSYDDYKKEKKL